MAEKIKETSKDITELTLENEEKLLKQNNKNIKLKIIIPDLENRINNLISNLNSYKN